MLQTEDDTPLGGRKTTREQAFVTQLTRPDPTGPGRAAVGTSPSADRNMVVATIGYRSL